METLYFLGIDISKRKIDAALTVDGIHVVEVQTENSIEHIGKLFTELKKQFGFGYHQLVVCVDYTGIYCQPLLDYVVKNNINTAVESALHIKQSQGMTRGKSDRVDAKRIASFAFKNYRELKLWKPQRKVVEKLKALLVARERLVRIKLQIKVPINEARKFVDESIRKMVMQNCRKTLKSLSEDIRGIEREIDQLIRGDKELKQQMQWASSVTGIGKITAANIIAATGEFERINDVRKFACYAGIAPFEHSSGTSVRGKTRVSKMANMTMKRLLHLAAMTAIQHCDDLKLFYYRKVAAGKNKMSVLNAVRNKLISRVFACVKGKRNYQKIYQNALV